MREGEARRYGGKKIVGMVGIICDRIVSAELKVEEAAGGVQCRRSHPGRDGVLMI